MSITQLTTNHMGDWKKYIAQEDILCDFCSVEIPRGDWHWQDGTDAMCTDCQAKREAKAELLQEE